MSSSRCSLSGTPMRLASFAAKRGQLMMAPNGPGSGPGSGSSRKLSTSVGASLSRYSVLTDFIRVSPTSVMSICSFLISGI